MKKFYKITLSTKQEIEIDEEDFKKVESNLGSGNLIRVKQGIFNPSFLVSITPITKEAKEKLEGYIDHKKGVFIETGRKKIDPALEDEFPNKSIVTRK
jgi:hypothetical protein